MGDNDEGHAECAVQFQKQFGDGIAGPLVQVAGRLVGQQHAGLQQDGPRNGGALTLAAAREMNPSDESYSNMPVWKMPATL